GRFLHPQRPIDRQFWQDLAQLDFWQRLSNNGGATQREQDQAHPPWRCKPAACINDYHGRELLHSARGCKGWEPDRSTADQIEFRPFFRRTSSSETICRGSILTVLSSSSTIKTECAPSAM